jgi:hypothetical protein
MAEPHTRPTTAQLLKYFLYLGSLGFGGPVALVGYMQRDLVERRAWFTRDEYMKSLALSQLAPGPLAAQVAICLGFVHSRLAGATLVSLAFVLPSSPPGRSRRSSGCSSWPASSPWSPTRRRPGSGARRPPASRSF